jgi:hypothetical protein
MRFWFRLITTFDEVPPLSARACRIDKSPCRCKHRLRELNGVDLKRVPPKSRPAAPHGRNHPLAWIVPYVLRGSQGLRRPRFSFFRFTCQTAWDRNPVSGHARDFAKQTPSVRTDGYSLLSVKSFSRAASLHSSAAPGVSLYRPPPRTMSTRDLKFFSSDRHRADRWVFPRKCRARTLPDAWFWPTPRSGKRSETPSGR